MRSVLLLCALTVSLSACGASPVITASSMPTQIRSETLAGRTMVMEHTMAPVAMRSAPRSMETEQSFHVLQQVACDPR